jgi:hypothetical protein
MLNMSRGETLKFDHQYGGDLSWSGYKWNEGNTSVKGTEEQLGFYTARIPVMDTTGD